MSVGQCRAGNRPFLSIMLALATTLFQFLPFNPFTRKIVEEILNLLILKIW